MSRDFSNMRVELQSGISLVIIGFYIIIKLQIPIEATYKMIRPGYFSGREFTVLAVNKWLMMGT